MIFCFVLLFRVVVRAETRLQGVDRRAGSKEVEFILSRSLIEKETVVV